MLCKKCKFIVSEVGADICTAGTCMGNGLCIQITGQEKMETRCSCLPGWEGIDCSENIDECGITNTPCQSGSTCVDLVNDFICICPSDKTGVLCAEGQ